MYIIMYLCSFSYIIEKAEEHMYNYRDSIAVVR